MTKSTPAPCRLQAGAAEVDITPEGSVFLYGYPHVERLSAGVHDPLLCSALFLADGAGQVLLISCDVIFVSKALAAEARDRIERRTGVPAGHVLIGATHTHSGPVTVDYLSNASDLVVPKADAAYLRRLCDAVVETATRAVESCRPAELAFVVADGRCVGTNRRDPAGPADPDVPVVLVRAADGRPVGAMLVCSMHPTVLHEDSLLISADFPGAARDYVRRAVLGAPCPVVYFTGPCGNQSPRHVTRANTFAEAERLGFALGRSIERAAAGAWYVPSADIACRRALIELPRRRMPSLAAARSQLEAARDRLQRLRGAGAARQEVRTAECDWFGAEESLALAEAALDGRLADVCDGVMPAEVQVISVGPWRLVGWPGEVFVEYALELKRRAERTFVISLANGELQGYIVTPEAAAEGGYEASNALFAPESGERLVSSTLALLSGT